MAEAISEGEARYLTVAELSRRSGLSLATLHRLKAAGKIPFYQPGGKGARLLFPPDAIERAAHAGESQHSTTTNVPQHLAGPRPGWMLGRKGTS